ncbi:MAG: glycosyltransferase family 4 protein [Cyclobacteriaceae bacterium]|nr:glycosyltransferase family 4 protein [Cyclobacteriaceae bacterium]
MKKKLVIISTHPIQYNAPLFRKIAESGNIELKVFYTWSQAKEKVEDKGFKRSISWDIPLLEGYDYEFVENVAKKPDNKKFYGIDNPDLIPKIKTFNPDAILVFGWNHKSHLQVMRHFKGKIPIWFRGDSTLLDYDYKTIKELQASSFQLPAIKSYLLFKARTLFLRFIYRYVDKAFYVGTHNKAYFLHHGLKAEQLVYAPHAVDNDRFADNEERQYEAMAKKWRRELGYSDDDFVVLYAGKFEPVKNLEILITAFNQIKQQDIKKLHLLLLGNGILEDRLREMSQENDLIKFLPFQNQSQMPVVYRLANVFCLPSKSETWGLALNEAMACGIPVIYSNKCGAGIDLKIESNPNSIFSDNLKSFQSVLDNFITLYNSDIDKLANNTLAHVQGFSYEQVIHTLSNSFSTLGRH